MGTYVYIYILYIGATKKMEAQCIMMSVKLVFSIFSRVAIVKDHPSDHEICYVPIKSQPDYATLFLA